MGRSSPAAVPRRAEAAVEAGRQMYVAHIMLFLLFTAQIARTVRTIRQSDVCE